MSIETTFSADRKSWVNWDSETQGSLMERAMQRGQEVICFVSHIDLRAHPGSAFDLLAERGITLEEYRAALAGKEYRAA